MKIAYFDCFSGVSGDMTLGAFVDAGLSIDVLKEQLALLHLHGYELSAEKVKRAGVAGTKVHVIISRDDAHTHSQHAHHHHHHSRFSFSDIRSLIEESKLQQDIKESSIKVFHRLAQAEAKVHKSTVEEVHFHEVGAVDSIVDIVGSV
ncbi:MAG: nickel insertion protein, partial [Planctomycetota bacterium]